MAELVQVVREVRKEIVSALSMAGIGGRSEKSENPDIDLADMEKVLQEKLGARQNTVSRV